MTGLTGKATLGECENVRGMTQEQALLEAIDPPLTSTVRAKP